MKRLIILLIFASLITVIKAQPISQLPAASTLNPADLIPIVQSGVTKKIQAAKIVQFLADSLSNVRILSDTCLEVTYRGALDTMCFSQQDLNWIVTGNDIENSNTGDVTLKGQVYVPDIAASGAKYSGTIAGIGIDDRLFPLSIVNLHEDTKDTLIILKAYGRENELTVGAVEEMYSDFSVAVAAAGAGDILDLSNATFTETGTVTLPANGTIIFQPGALLSGTFTLVGNNTYIDAGQQQIFGANVTLSGTWKYEYCTPAWFGADPTGVTDAAAIFTKLDNLFYDGAKMLCKPGTYKIGSGVIWLPHDNLTLDFNNATLVGNAANVSFLINYPSSVDASYTTNFLSGFSSAEFTGTFVKGSNYIAIADSADWQAHGNFKVPCKINVVSTDSATLYKRSATFTYKDFGTEGANQVIYASTAFPLDLDPSSLKQTGGVDMIYIYPMWSNYTVKNLTTVNLEFRVSLVNNLYIDNVRMSCSPNNTSAVRWGLFTELCDNVFITNYQASNFQYAGLGYGILCYSTDNLIIDGFKIENCRHGINFSGVYESISTNMLVTNGTLIRTNLDAHGNTYGVVIDGVNSYNGGAVLSSRANGGTVRNCNIYNLDAGTPAVHFANVDPTDDDDIIVDNINVYESQSDAVFIEGADVNNVQINNVNLVNTTDFSNSHVLLRVDNSTIDRLYLKNSSIQTPKTDLGTVFFCDTNTISLVNIENVKATNISNFIYSNVTAIDSLVVDNVTVKDYEGFHTTYKFTDPVKFIVKNSTFINGVVFLNMTVVDDSVHYQIYNNEINSLNGITGGTPSGYTLKFENNNIKHYYSALLPLIPLTATDITFSGNYIQATDSTEAQSHIANRSGDLSAVTFTDALNFAGSRSNDARLIIERNIIKAKLNTSTSMFALTDGRLYFNDNIVEPVGGVFPNYWIVVNNLDTASFVGNRFVINNASLTRVIFPNINSTTAGSYRLADNSVINSKAAGAFVAVGAWTGASKWYIGAEHYNNMASDNSYGGSSVVVYDKEVGGNKHISGLGTLGIYTGGTVILRTPQVHWTGISGADNNVYIGAATGKINPSSNGTDNNVGIGYSALPAADGGSNLVSIGTGAGYTNSSGSGSIDVGYHAGFLRTTGNRMINIGYQAGNNSVTGSYGINIGNGAGYKETGSYKFYVAFDSTAPAFGMREGAAVSRLLMYGDASNATKANHFLNIYAKVAIGAYKTPTVSLDVTGSADISGYLKTGQGGIADNDATPDVSGYNNFIYTGSANSVTITDLDNPVAGAYYVILGNSDTYTVTIADSGNFKLSAACVLGVDDVITLFCKADNYYVEISRSNN